MNLAKCPKIGDLLVINTDIVYKFSTVGRGSRLEHDPTVRVKRGDKFIVIEKCLRETRYSKSKFKVFVLIHAKTLLKMEFQDQKYNWQLFDLYKESEP